MEANLQGFHIAGLVDFSKNLLGDVGPRLGEPGCSRARAPLKRDLLGCSGDLVSQLVMGLMGLIMACHGGLWGMLLGLTKSTDYPSRVPLRGFGGSDLEPLVGCFYQIWGSPSRVERFLLA